MNPGDELDQRPVGALGPDGPYPAFGVTVRRGARGGDVTVRTPSLARTSSNEAVNLASRSRIGKRKEPVQSARSMTKLRAYRAVQAPSGYRVTPRMCTGRVATAMTHSTYKRLRKIVSTVKKPHASRPSPWGRRSAAPPPRRR